MSLMGWGWGAEEVLYKEHILSGICMSYRGLHLLIKFFFGFSISNIMSMHHCSCASFKLEIMITSALILSELCKVPMRHLGTIKGFKTIKQQVNKSISSLIIQIVFHLTAILCPELWKQLWIVQLFRAQSNYSERNFLSNSFIAYWGLNMH